MAVTPSMVSRQPNLVASLYNSRFWFVNGYFELISRFGLRIAHCEEGNSFYLFYGVLSLCLLNLQFFDLFFVYSLISTSKNRGHFWQTRVWRWNSESEGNSLKGFLSGKPDCYSKHYPEPLS